MGISGDKRTFHYEVTGSPAVALQTARQALEGERFVVTEVDEWTLRAARGKKAKAFLVGAMSPFVEVGVSARSVPGTGTTIIEVAQRSSGFAFAGGVIGAKKSRTAIDAALARLVDAYRTAGVFQRQIEP
jgi:hypothetical protein